MRMPLLGYERPYQKEDPVRDYFLSIEIDDSLNDRALANHGQPLARLKERGGLSVEEAIAIIEDRKFRHMSPQEKVNWLEQHRKPDQQINALAEENNKLTKCIAYLKNILWVESNRTVLAHDSMDAAIEVCTKVIGKSE